MIGKRARRGGGFNNLLLLFQRLYLLAADHPPEWNLLHSFVVLQRYRELIGGCCILGTAHPIAASLRIVYFVLVTHLVFVVSCLAVDRRWRWRGR